MQKPSMHYITQHTFVIS